ADPLALPLRDQRAGRAGDRRLGKSPRRQRPPAATSYSAALRRTFEEVTMKHAALILLSSMALAAGDSLAQPAKFSDGSVKIGVLSDMSGLYADLGGAGSVISVQMAIDDFKARYKPAWKIELVSADHQNKADVGAARVREWYERDGV